MKRFEVLIQIHHSEKSKETRAIVVEAGNKKLAAIRALRLLTENGLTDVYKQVQSVVEVV